MSDELMLNGGGPPCVYLQLKGSQTKQLEDVEPGSGVKVVLTGKVVSVTERDEDGRYSGTLEVEYSRMKILPEDNEFGKLVADDD